MLTVESIRSAFANRIEPVREPALYRLAVAAAAGAMILLPLIYVALVALAGWAWSYYVFEVLPQFKRVNVITLAPVPVGPILIVFLLKPLLARGEKASPPLTLNREQAPLLFELVDRLCDNVGAPRPRRIDATVDVNASASLRRGWLSLFSHDLVLTIGLPLVQGLSLREFTAVLAHEFGHFRQGAGMAFNLIIRSISYWFARVVYERDQWDARLIRWSGLDWRISIIAYLAHFFIWVSRKILQGLMLAGHALAGFLSRQMEFDADQVAVRVAGDRAFAATMTRLPVLDLASNWAHRDLAHSWQKGRLGDDFPALVASNLHQLPGDQTQAAVEAAMDGAVSMYASHPPTKQRIERAESTPAAGIFQLDGAATELFGDFEATCKDASLHSYQVWIGDTVTAEKLISSKQVAAEGAEALRLKLARERVFHDWYDGSIWFHLPSGQAPQGDDQPEKATAARELADTAFSRIIELEQVLAYIDTGLQVPAADFNLPKADRPTVERILGDTRREWALAEGELRGATAGVTRRALGVSTLAASAARRLRLIESIEPHFNQLIIEMRIGEALLSQLQANDAHEQLRAVALAQGPAVYRAVETLEAALGAERGALGLTDPTKRDPEDNPINAIRTAGLLLTRISTVYCVALGEVAEAMERQATTGHS